MFSAYARIAEPLTQAKKLFHVPGSTQFRLPVYMMFPRDSDSPVLQQVLESLRSLDRCRTTKNRELNSSHNGSKNETST
jgi:hypothetical protein